jgi:hypothetical protein
MAHLPPRSTLHGWLIRWHCDGVLDRILRCTKRRGERAGKEASPTAMSDFTCAFCLCGGLGSTVSAIGEDALQEYEYPPHLLEQRDKAVAVLDIGWGDGHTEHQAQRVDNGVALLALTGCK